MKHTYDCRDALHAAGITWEDAYRLRRISMTLHRWHELECGDSNEWRSECIVRGKKTGKVFEYDDNAKPYLEIHYHRGEPKAQYWPTPDRERGALKRLDKIMKRYPGFGYHVQGDPRGCALYILRPGDVQSIKDTGGKIDAYYTRGIAVCK